MNKLEYVVGSMSMLVESEGNITCVENADEIEINNDFYVQFGTMRFESDEEVNIKIIVGKEGVAEEKKLEEYDWTPNPSMFGTFNVVPNPKNEDRKMVFHLKNFLQEVLSKRVFVKSEEFNYQLSEYWFERDFEKGTCKLILEGFEYKENDI